jgi:hypothetical protein
MLRHQTGEAPSALASLHSANWSLVRSFAPACPQDRDSLVQEASLLTRNPLRADATLYPGDDMPMNGSFAPEAVIPSICVSAKLPG